MKTDSKKIALFVVYTSVLNFYLVSGKSVCTEEELNEAQRAFRNCVESAKAGIVSAHANEENQDLVCDSLENMLAGCELQVDRLSYCSSKAHVDNLKAIHLSSITDVIQAINNQVDVSTCSVYTEKTINGPVVTPESNNNEVDLGSLEKLTTNHVASSASTFHHMVSTSRLSSIFILICPLLIVLKK